jgi:hypothetical protein
MQWLAAGETTQWSQCDWRSCVALAFVKARNALQEELPQPQAPFHESVK